MSAPNNGFIRHIINLNKSDSDHFRPFYIAQQRVGAVKDFMCEALSQWPEYFSIYADKIELNSNGNDKKAVSQILDQVVRRLVKQGVIANYLEEAYPVTGSSRDQVFAVMDRGAAAYFGIKAYGQHLNGYVNSADGLKLWVARRADDRIHFPGKLDNIVAGGLPSHLTLHKNLIKECKEEANIPENMLTSARATGAITYCCETAVGLKPDTLYCYDLELPQFFTPENTDGEVAEFQLLNIEEVAQLVHDTDEFKPNCNLVIIDFLIRHGVIRPDQENYLEMVAGLHSPL